MTIWSAPLRSHWKGLAAPVTVRPRLCSPAKGWNWFFSAAIGCAFLRLAQTRWRRGLK
jgi:hypothetical protein